MHNSDYYRERADYYRLLAAAAENAAGKQECLQLAAACRRGGRQDGRLSSEWIASLVRFRTTADVALRLNKMLDRISERPQRVVFLHALVQSRFFNQAVAPYLLAETVGINASCTPLQQPLRRSAGIRPQFCGRSSRKDFSCSGRERRVADRPRRTAPHLSPIAERVHAGQRYATALTSVAVANACLRIMGRAVS